MKFVQIKYALAIFALSFFSIDCANAQIVSRTKTPETETMMTEQDLSTDEGVIAALQEIRDAKNSVSTGDERLDAKRRAAGKLEKKDVCIGRVKESAKVIVIGFFRTDVGCRFDGAFVNSRFHNRDEADLSKIALAALGWEKADRAGRERLAKIWVGECLLVFSQIPYQQVSAVISDDEIKITVTSQYPAGVTSRSTPKRFVFDKEGRMLSADNF